MCQAVGTLKAALHRKKTETCFVGLIVTFQLIEEMGKQ